MYAIQAILVQWYPSEHPLVRLLRQSPDPAMLVLCCLSAVVVAPLFEEFVFRVLLQGWLEKVLAADPVPQVPEVASAFASKRAAVAIPSARVDADALASADVNPFKSPESEQQYTGPPRAGETSGQVAGSRLPLRFSANVLPILISSTVFAGLHYGHGPDPIPLFVLAAALGYLYQRTHRLVPGLMVHVLLNASSMVMLWWDLR